MKNMDTLEVHTSSFRPPGHHYLPHTVGMTEPTLPGIHVCPRRVGRQTLPDRSHDGFCTALACSTALYLIACSDR